MRKEYLNVLENEFKQLVFEVLGFEIKTGDESLVPNDWTVYERTFDRKYIYIVLAPNPKNDSYTVEIAWSNHGEFPKMLLPMFLSDQPVDGQFRFRIGEFWGDHDFWEYFGKREVDAKYKSEKNHMYAKIKTSANWMVARLQEYLPKYLNSIKEHEGQN